MRWRLDQLLPHPVYAWMSWVCVPAPSANTFEALKPLIWEAYKNAKERSAKKKL